jgi:putative membrane protein
VRRERSDRRPRDVIEDVEETGPTTVGPRRDNRWPGWVFGEGAEPDPRFSFANERTLLAGLRTSLALISGGVAVNVVSVPIASWGQHVLTVELLALGGVFSLGSWVRWARAERAMRRGLPLPSFPFGAVLAVAIAICAVTVLGAL